MISMAPSPSAALGPLYCMIDGKKIEITGSKNINLEPETTYEYCIVRDTGECYTSYKSFIKKHCSHRLSDWKEDQLPLKDRFYKIITKAPHESEKDVTVYIIEDINTKQIYLIGSSQFCFPIYVCILSACCSVIATIVISKDYDHVRLLFSRHSGNRRTRVNVLFYKLLIVRLYGNVAVFIKNTMNFVWENAFFR